MKSSLIVLLFIVAMLITLFIIMNSREDTTSGGRGPGSRTRGNTNSFGGRGDAHNESSPPVTTRKAPVYPEEFWLANFPPGYKEFVKLHRLRERMVPILDRQMKNAGNADLLELNITRENLVDLLCLHEFTRDRSRIMEEAFELAIDGMPYEEIAKVMAGPLYIQPLDKVRVVSFKDCNIDWIPVTELSYLYKNLKVVRFTNVGGKFTLNDLPLLPYLTGVTLDRIPIKEFPYFFSRLPRLTLIEVSNTEITTIDLTDKNPFLKVKTLIVCYEGEVTLKEVLGLKTGFPSLQIVYVMGSDEIERWNKLVEVYLPKKKVEVLEAVAFAEEVPQVTVSEQFIEYLKQTGRI